MILDTCGILAWMTCPEALSSTTLAGIDRAARRDDLGCAAISVWEIAWKHRLGKLHLAVPLTTFDRELRRLPLCVHAIDHDLWWSMAHLDWPHRDPADRLIVTLARRLACPIVSNDAAIAGVHECLW